MNGAWTNPDELTVTMSKVEMQLIAEALGHLPWARSDPGPILVALREFAHAALND